MNFEKYLIAHTIVVIGKGCLDGEVIVDDPPGVIHTAEESKYYIAEIRWWDRAKIATGSTIGYGGPRDPKDPNTYFFAETDIDKVFSANTEACTYYDYLRQIINENCCYDLRPAFIFKER